MVDRPVTSRALAAATLSSTRGPGDPHLGREWVNVLADVPLFQSVTKRQLRKIAETAVGARYQPHTEIIRKGERGETFFVILDGTARVEAGKRPKRLRTGDYFGEMALLDGEVRSATVTAETEVHVMRLSRRRFLRMLERDPNLTLLLLKGLARRLRAAERPRSV
jgi:CRP/FNR family transcriptional regulator, cyclic AMP receptor protein